MILNLLNNYVPNDLIEQEDKCKMLNFLSREPNCFERNCEEGHFTASCWIENVYGTAVLLTHHKKFNAWLQLGGHADGDSNLLRVSLKEAFEESGFSVEPVNENIFDVGVHFIPPYEDVYQHYHYDVKFHLRAIKDEPFVVSDESYDLKWVYEEDQLPDNIEVKRMFRKWKSRSALVNN
ncbi:MAG: NUDIX hydrolase [Holosporales bacterium]|jgi:8-oxo-dGTP pyrophosphatase MutT (NUDIX family)|nr:NUDIX hydrolase [Holosporales bacterium]